MNATTTTDVSATARDLVHEALREFGPGGRLNAWNEGQFNPGGLLQKVHHLAQKRGVPTTGGFWPAVTEYVWTLARIGALALMPYEQVHGPVQDEQRNIQSFIVTDFGRQLLAEPDFSPQDWAKYKASTLVRVSAPDDIVIAYLAEAVEAWKSTLYRSSVIMLGAACERLIILLAEAVAGASLHPFSKKVTDLLESDTPVGISRLFTTVRAPLVDAGNPAKLPPKLRDAIDRKLSPIFEYARELRNAQGHPTGAIVTKEEGEAALKLFPGFYELVDSLIQHLRPASAPGAVGP